MMFCEEIMEFNYNNCVYFVKCLVLIRGEFWCNDIKELIVGVFYLFFKYYKFIFDDLD